MNGMHLFIFNLLSGSCYFIKKHYYQRTCIEKKYYIVELRYLKATH